MPLVIRCDHCQSALRLPEEHIGKEVRCPSCQRTFLAQNLEEPPPPRRQAAPSEEGPRQVNEPDRPSRRRDDDDDGYRRPSRRRRYYDDDYDRGPRRESHRGSAILTLGILSLCLFCIPLASISLGITAIVMATTDLNKMRNDLMDSDGRGSTNAGMVCGILGLVLTVVILVLACMGGALNPN